MLRYVILLALIISVTPLAMADSHNVPREQPTEQEFNSKLEQENAHLHQVIEVLKQDIKDQRNEIKSLNNEINFLVKEFSFSIIQLNEWFRAQLM